MIKFFWKFWRSRCFILSLLFFFLNFLINLVSVISSDNTNLSLFIFNCLRSRVLLINHKAISTSNIFLAFYIISQPYRFRLNRIWYCYGIILTTAIFCSQLTDKTLLSLLLNLQNLPSFVKFRYFQNLHANNFELLLEVILVENIFEGLVVIYCFNKFLFWDNTVLVFHSIFIFIKSVGLLVRNKRYFVESLA